MSLSFSSISETALADLPSPRAVSDLEIELFGNASIISNLPANTGTLVLSNSTDEVYAIYYGGGLESWLVPLHTSVTDRTQQIFNFVEELNLELSIEAENSIVVKSIETIELDLNIIADNTVRHEIPDDIVNIDIRLNSIERISWLISDPIKLNLDGNYTNNLTLYSTESVSLIVDAVEQQFVDDLPSDKWRDRSGLPIGPISLNPIGVEQRLDFVAKIYPLISQAPLSIEADALISSTLIREFEAVLVIADAGTESNSRSDISAGNLTTFSISDQVVFLNSNETSRLEISAVDEIQQIFEFAESVDIDIDSNEAISTTLVAIETAPIQIDFKTYAKEYTFLQQISENNKIRVSITVESSESFGTTSRPKQVWFG